MAITNEAKLRGIGRPKKTVGRISLYQREKPILDHPLQKIGVVGERAMISVLAQERLLGAALGSVFAGVVVFEQRKSIYKSISQNQPQFITQAQMREPILGKKSHFEFANLWNKAVDQTLGPVIEFLSSRGW